MINNNVKPINCGFVVICSNFKFYSIKNTLDSIKTNYKNSKITCIIPEFINDLNIIEKIKSYSVIIKSNENSTSLLNESFKNLPCPDWNFIVYGGNWLKSSLDIKYIKYITNEKDILFPLVDKKSNFSDGISKGVLIHKKAIKDIGQLEETQSFEYNKYHWMNKAIKKGYKFKAIYGLNLY